MKNCVLLVGPPGSGKSTLSKEYIGYTYINQDSQGKEHLEIFAKAISDGSDVIVDRMGFSKLQRDRYLELAKKNNYSTKIIVLHESYSTCLERCLTRKNHETIKDEKSAKSALNTFFSKYERVEDSEADVVNRIWPNKFKPTAIVVDLDGSLCNVDHRLHFVRGEGKKNWKAFFEGLIEDKVNYWCRDVIVGLFDTHTIIYASGRPDDYRKQTEQWLDENNLNLHEGHLYMRPRGDHRQDYITKEVILDFEILTQFTPIFFIDDRKQVVDLWRKRGFICLHCADGDF